MSNNTYIVISLGGSLIVPDNVDIQFLKDFISLIKAQVAIGKRFAIIAGGGHIAREYRDALVALGVEDTTILDEMGITATRMNAELLRQLMGTLAEPQIFLDPTQTTLTDKPVLVGGGWKPGHSSDGSAVGLAKSIGATKLINLSNIEYVYTADPRIDPNATPIEKITWTDFRVLLPNEWQPGSNTPFDPIAAKMAEEIDLEVVVMNGKNLDNLKNYLEAQTFIGTTIKN